MSVPPGAQLPMAPTVGAPPAPSPQEIAALQDEVRALAAVRDAVILAHNYQVPEIQDVADYVGDSLGLSRARPPREAETIVFCGVHFMAETASILCPQKTVLIPDLDAGCSLAESIDAEQLAAWRERYPDGVVVMYVNTTAEVKALTDYCCTSANAVDVVRHIYDTHGRRHRDPVRPRHVARRLRREGARPAHARVGRRVPRPRRHPAGRHRSHARRAPRRGLPDPPRVRLLDERHGVRRRGRHRRGGRAHALDRRHAPLRRRTPRPTSGARRSRRATGAPARPSWRPRWGCSIPLQMAAPDIEFVPANAEASCRFMKMITLPKLRDALRDVQFEVRVPEDVATRARVPDRQDGRDRGIGVRRQRA